MEIAGVPALTPESGDSDIWKAVYVASHLTQGLPIWDRSRVYAEMMTLLEHAGGPGLIPDTIEELFFDELTHDISTAFVDEGKEIAPRGRRVPEPLPWDEPDEEAPPQEITIKRAKRKVGGR